MADQSIFFEQGSSATGDSGERGNSTAAGGGVQSVKPIADGERAHQAILRRPEENIRKRTERLRDAGEQSKYLMDSGMRWIAAGGLADGLSAGPEPMPGITGWSPTPTTGSFVATNPMVVQPITTPSADVQEDAAYGFPYGVDTGVITFTPISIADPPSDPDALTNKRAYNGANLIKIIWEAKTSVELAGATVPGFCNAVLSGDPEHILTISILDTGATQLAQLDTALAALVTRAELIGDIGLEYVISGSVAQVMDITDISSDPKGVDYRMVGTFEREIHYIPTATFVDFFAANELTDGDTLAIQFADYTTDAVAADPLTGRRERVPSNNSTTYPNNTTVLAADLFITSNPVDVYKIPLCVPLCKRIGDDLYWLDGTVIVDSQGGAPIYMGEHGYTVNRIVSAATTVLMNVYVDPTSPLSADPVGLTNISIQANVENLVRYINTKGSMYQDETVTGVWTFAPPRSTGTPTADLYSAKVISTLDGIAIVGDYTSLYNELELSAGSVSLDTRGVHHNLTFSGGSAGQVWGDVTDIIVESGGTVLGTIRGLYSKIDTDVASTIGGTIYAANFIVDNDADLSGADTIYGYDLYVNNSGDLDTGNVYGSVSRVVNSGTLTSGRLTGYRTQVTGAGGTLTNGNLYGILVDIASAGILTNGIVYGADIDVNIEAAASLGDELRGLNVDLAIASGATITSDVYGGYIAIDNDTTLSNDLYGLKVSIGNTGGTVNGDLYGLYLNRGFPGTVTGQRWCIYATGGDPSLHRGELNVGASAHPGGPEAIQLAIDGAFATHTNGIEDLGNPGTGDQEPSVANVGILEASPALSGSFTIESLQDGVVGQWLIIQNKANAAQGNITIEADGGGGAYQTFKITSDIVLSPGEGVLCYFGGTYWHVVHK